MEISTSTDTNTVEICRKLASIQEELFVPKGNKNSFGNYNYRTCEDILKAVKPLCSKNNCVLKMDNDLVEVAGRVYVRATVKLFDCESGQCAISRAIAREPESKKGMDEAQVTGASLSYARKYALAGLFCIDNEKDADVTNKQSKEEETHDTVSAQQLNAIYKELERTGISESKILDFIKKKHLEEATQEDYLLIMKKLNVTPDKAPEKEAN